MAPSTITFPPGSVPGGDPAVGAVSSSAGAGAGDGRSVVPAKSGSPGRSVAVPSHAAGPVPSLPAWVLPWGLGGSAVPAGVPGKGSSPASVRSCPTASGIGARPVPAPRFGSTGRGRSEGMLSRADPQPAPHGCQLGAPGRSVAPMHVAGTRCRRPRATTGPGPGGTCLAALPRRGPQAGAGDGGALRGARPAAETGAEPCTALHNHCGERGESSARRCRASAITHRRWASAPGIVPPVPLC